MDGGAWSAAAHGVTKSWTRLSDFTSLKEIIEDTQLGLSDVKSSKEGNSEKLSQPREASGAMRTIRDSGSWVEQEKDIRGKQRKGKPSTVAVD